MEKNGEEKQDKFDEYGQVVGGYISLDQAQVLAIRHARANTDFYGPAYSSRELVWEIAGAEEGEDYYQVRLSYRPARRFRGQPGLELFTIGKTAEIELRQVLSEPIEKRRFALLAIAIGLVVASVAVVGGLFVAGVFSGSESPTPTPSPMGSAATERVTINMAAGEAAQLVSPGG